ncbi:MAG: hypothetical protein K2H73_09760 [Treponemataceae bacterium]|nr:hypothetical protein [Treponemataceae bacterium]
MHDFVEQLKKLRNEDKTLWLITRVEILDYFGKTSNQGVKDLIRDVLNRLSGEIDESIGREKEIL